MVIQLINVKGGDEGLYRDKISWLFSYVKG